MTQRSVSKSTEVSSFVADCRCRIRPKRQPRTARHQRLGGTNDRPAATHLSVNSRSAPVPAYYCRSL